MAATRAVPRGYGTRAEVADYLGYKPQTLANWKSQGKGPRCTGEGRNLRYRWADVEEWDRARRRTP
jgi:hypothetical protein